MQAIEVLDIRLLEGDRPIRGFADVRFSTSDGEWTIRDWRIEKHNGQRAAVSSPVSSWRNPQTRQILFKGIITMPAELKQAIELAVLTAYQQAVEERNANQSNSQ